MWLADFAVPHPGDKVCDLGCGEGIITLELAARIEAHFIGIDVLESAVGIAAEKLKSKAASLKGEVGFQKLRIQEAPRKLGRFSFDMVVCNPPFYKPGEGRSSPDPDRRHAREESTVNLTEIIEVTGQLLKDKGIFCCILPPERLTELFSLMEKYQMGLKQICPVYTKPDSPALRILIKARKRVKGLTEILPALQLY